MTSERPTRSDARPRFSGHRDDPAVIALWRRFHRVPVVGAWAFSTLFSVKTPFAGAIHARFVGIEPNLVSLRIPHRRSVRNHLGSIHAAALCTGLESAVGTLAEATIPQTMRWIPTRMQVEYLALARGAVMCTARTSADAWSAGSSEVLVDVSGVLADGTPVIAGVVTLKVTARR